MFHKWTDNVHICSERTFSVHTSDSIIVLGLYIMRGTGRIVLLSWGLYIMRGTGLEQWSGVA